jgi:hypothetical protein
MNSSYATWPNLLEDSSGLARRIVAGSQLTPLRTSFLHQTWWREPAATGDNFSYSKNNFANYISISTCVDFIMVYGVPVTLYAEDNNIIMYSPHQNKWIIHAQFMSALYEYYMHYCLFSYT